MNCIDELIFPTGTDPLISKGSSKHICSHLNALIVKKNGGFKPCGTPCPVSATTK